MEGDSCLIEQAFVVGSDGSFESIGPCVGLYGNLGPPFSLRVFANEVVYTGEFVDPVAWQRCTEGCCTGGCPSPCYTGYPDFVTGCRIVFNRPVWPRFLFADLVDNGAAGVARVEFEMIQGFGHMPFTSSQADFTADGTVDGADLAWLLELWGQSWTRLDLDDSGSIDGGDVASLLADWGPIP